MAQEPNPGTGIAAGAARPTGNALEFRGLAKSFGSTRALRDVSFDVRAGTVHALLGGNGSGKSTLIKSLAGVHRADAGTIAVSGREYDATAMTPGDAHDAGLRFVHQAVGTFPDMTVAENFALGSSFDAEGLRRVRWKRLHRRVEEVLERFSVQVRPDAMMCDLSPATQTMVAIARVLQDVSEGIEGVLVLDEPTASLPKSEVEVLHGAIRGWVANGQTVVLVTHHLEEVIEIATDATFLRDGRHLETGPVAGMDERAMVQRIAGMERAPVDARKVVRGDVRASVRGVRSGPLRDATLDLHGGEIVGIAGLLGSGRSTLLRTIFQDASVDAGAVEVDGTPVTADHPSASMRRGVAYLPEDRGAEGAFLSLSVRENLAIPAPDRYWSGWRLSLRAEGRTADDVIERYGIKTDTADALMSSLSGGNQQKTMLARWLELEPRILLLDEPTQGVDVGARAAIHVMVRAAADAGTAVAVVSSDEKELVELCDRVVGIRDGRIQGELRDADLTVERCVALTQGIGRDDTPPTPDHPQGTTQKELA